MEKLLELKLIKYYFHSDLKNNILKLEWKHFVEQGSFNILLFNF